MTIPELIRKRRTIRRFRQTRIPRDVLETIVDAGRLAPSASNLQPLEYVLVDDEKLLPRIFQHTKWAGYLPPEEGRPPQGREPVAYVVVLINENIARSRWAGHDVGAATENMILAALSHGIGSCWIGSVDREAVAKILGVPNGYTIDSILALGYPDEQPVAEPMKDSVKYYKDEKGVLHVPKRRLEDILHYNGFDSTRKEGST